MVFDQFIYFWNLAYFKVQSESHAYFDCKYLVNGNTWANIIIAIIQEVRSGFRLACLHLILNHSKRGRSVSFKFYWTIFENSVTLHVSLCQHLSCSPSVCPSVRSFVRPSICLSAFPSVCLFVRPSVCPSVRSSVCLSVRSFVLLSVSWFVRPSVHPSVRSSISLSVRQFVLSSFRLSFRTNTPVHFPVCQRLRCPF